MSYILDALRKSDEERKQRQDAQEQPGLAGFIRPKAAGRNKRTPALILTSFMLLVIVILAGGWWYTSRESEQIKTDLSSAGAVQSPASDISEQRITAPEAELVREEKPTAQIAAPAPSSEQAQPIPPEELSYLADLPFEVQSSIPEMNFSGHVYSPTPELRLIMINGSIVREQDLVEPELMLEEITETGVIMRYRQRFFKIKLF